MRGGDNLTRGGDNPDVASSLFSPSQPLGDLAFQPDLTLIHQSPLAVWHLQWPALPTSITIHFHNPLSWSGQRSHSVAGSGHLLLIGLLSPGSSTQGGVPNAESLS